MQDLLNNLESAVKSVIDAGSLGIATFTGQNGHDQVRPCVTIYAEGGDERPISSGNFMTTVVVAVRSHASVTSIEQHKLTCNQVFALVMTNDLESVLSSNSNLFVFSPIVNRQASHGREDDSWLSELRFDAYCCLGDLV